MSNTKDTTVTEKLKAPERVPTDPRVDAEAREKLITARVALLLKAPFFGNLATRMKLINADEWCSTAATDGRHFYYNSNFIKKLPTKQVEFLFGHEVLHAVYDHMGRRQDRDPRISNIAADYCVNADLIDQKVGERINVVPILYEPKYRGMSYEEVYDDIMKNVKVITLDQLAEMLLDDHLDGNGDGDSEGESGDKTGKGRPTLSDEEKQAIKDEIRQAVLNAAQQAGAGNLPGGVKRLIKDLTESKMDWRSMLDMQIESTFKDDFTWLRPNRKSWHMDAVLPGMMPGNMVDVVVGIDTSGSISEHDIKIFLSEIKGIMESYEEYRIRVVSWDTEVCNPAEFSSDNLNDILEYEPGGGGGTDPTCVWEWLQENEIEPKKLIMFTDLCFYGESLTPYENYCDTVWIIKGNPNSEPEFGIWAHYEEEAVRA